MGHKFFELNRTKMEESVLSVIEAMDELVGQSTELVSLIIEEFELDKNFDKTLVELKRIKSDWNYKLVTLSFLNRNLIEDAQLISKIGNLITSVEDHITGLEKRKLCEGQYEKQGDQMDIPPASGICELVVDDIIKKSTTEPPNKWNKEEEINPGHIRQDLDVGDGSPTITTQILIGDLAKARIEGLGNHYQELVDKPDVMELNGVKRVIVCAANRYKDFVVTGVRHFCPTMRQQIKAIGLNDLRFYANGNEEQGFIDQFGVFLTREEAMVIARKGGQVTIGMEHHPTKLFSEDLY